MMQKGSTSSSMQSKTVIFGWIRHIIPQASNKMKLQDLGDGVIYCRIVNHYFPGSININRLNVNPKNQYEYSLNLKLFQNALTLHKITVPFDVGRISKQKFLQNWGLVNGLYRHLVYNNEDTGAGQDSKSVSYVSTKFTPKRSFQSAFSNQNSKKLLQDANCPIPVFNQPLNQATSYYQSSIQQYPSNTTYCNSLHNINPAAQLTQQVSNQPAVPHQNISSQNNPNKHNLNLSESAGLTQVKKAAMTFQHDSHSNFMNQRGFSFSDVNSPSTDPSNNVSQNLSFPNENREALLNRQKISSRQLNKVFEQNHLINKCWSIGKQISSRQSLDLYALNSQQNSGKYSVNSHIFQNNYNVVIDRVKQVLLKNSHDTEKIRQIKMLLSIPLNEDIVKIQEEQNIIVNSVNLPRLTQQNKTEKEVQTKTQPLINTKAIIKGQKQNSELPKGRGSRQILNCFQMKDIDGLKSLSKSNSLLELLHEKQTLSLNSKLPTQNEGRNIKNNFFSEGSEFRK